MSKPHTPDPNPANTHRQAPAAPPARVVIAGLGLVTPLGLNAWATFRALLQGQSIADRAKALPDALPPTDLVLALGGVSIARHTATDPAVELAERAAREAAAMAGRPTDGLRLWLGTSKGAIARLSTRQGLGHPPDEHDQHNIALGPHAFLAHQLAQRLGTSNQLQSGAACASGLVALDRARRTLAYADDTAEPYALVATADAALTPAFVHSYLRLGVLAEPTADGYRQRPLDQRRRGFMLSEIGAAVLLRRLSPGETPKPGEVELLHTATACEAFDMIRTPPTMPALTHIAGQLRDHLPQGETLGVLHPHAPGTPDHDPHELNVLREVFGDSPLLYACKGALGHGLGSAGLAALVIACLTLRANRLPPMPWLERPIYPPRNPEPQTPDSRATHAVFAAGFGGHTAGALIQRPRTGP
ncbi:MAG: beta-ketoacyl synthase N-terminal-like domain-containing protein [Planctomycetota bacterium]